MKDKEFLEWIEKQYNDLCKPYALDHEIVQHLLDSLDIWQRNPDNDVLRSRGDWKWIKAQELTGKLNRLLEPF